MANPKHLPQALLSLVLFLMLANKVMSDSTDFYIDRFNPDDPNLIFQGDAHVPPNSALLSLTKTDSSGTPEAQSVGRVVHSPPVKFWEASPPREAQFETTITFTITQSENGPADGISFFIAAVNTTIPEGSTGGNFGLYDSSGTATSLFAVEFDTFFNPDWDPDYTHIGCNFNSRQSNKTAHFDSATGEVVTARIDYVPETGIISVHASSESQSQVELSCVLDLKGILPDHVQVGIAASTGVYRSVHEIKSWYFHSNLVDVNLNGNDDKYIRQMV